MQREVEERPQQAFSRCLVWPCFHSHRREQVLLEGGLLVRGVGSAESSGGVVGSGTRREAPE